MEPSNIFFMSSWYFPEIFEFWGDKKCEKTSGGDSSEAIEKE